MFHLPSPLRPPAFLPHPPTLLHKLRVQKHPTIQDQPLLYISHLLEYKQNYLLIQYPFPLRNSRSKLIPGLPHNPLNPPSYLCIQLNLFSYQSNNSLFYLETTNIKRYSDLRGTFFKNTIAFLP